MREIFLDNIDCCFASAFTAVLRWMCHQFTHHAEYSYYNLFYLRTWTWTFTRNLPPAPINIRPLFTARYFFDNHSATHISPTAAQTNNCLIIIIIIIVISLLLATHSSAVCTAQSARYFAEIESSIWSRCSVYRIVILVTLPCIFPVQREWM